VPPDVSVPPAPAPYPASFANPPTIWCSIIVAVGDISHTANDWFSAPITLSIQTPTGSGADV